MGTPLASRPSHFKVFAPLLRLPWGRVATTLPCASFTVTVTFAAALRLRFMEAAPDFKLKPEPSTSTFFPTRAPIWAWNRPAVWVWRPVNKVLVCWACSRVEKLVSCCTMALGSCPADVGSWFLSWATSSCRKPFLSMVLLAVVVVLGVVMAVVAPIMPVCMGTSEKGETGIVPIRRRARRGGSSGWMRLALRELLAQQARPPGRVGQGRRGWQALPGRDAAPVGDQNCPIGVPAP